MSDSWLADTLTPVKHDLVYHDLLEDILENGIWKSNRTGIDTLSVFGRMIDLDVSQYVPVMTTKKLHLKSIIHELLWFIRGDTNIAYLKENGVSIWDEWADEKGEIGPMYGNQWRSWPTGRLKWTSSSESEPEMLDQLQSVIDTIKVDPDSRRLLVSAWNAPRVWDKSMKLAPCHYSWQIIVEEYRMSLKWDQRSVDAGCGLPFNVASYSFLLYMIASLTGYKPHRLIGALGDVHIYKNHIDQIKEQLSREPYWSPSLVLNPRSNINDFVFSDFELRDYVAHPNIKMPIAV